MDEPQDNGTADELQALRRRVRELEAEAARAATAGLNRAGDTTFNAIGDPAFILDREMRVVSINPALAAWSEQRGIDIDVIGRDILEAYPFLPTNAREDSRRVLETARPSVFEAPIDVGAEHIIYEVRRSPVVVDGEVVRVVNVLRDVTTRRQALQALAYCLELETLILKISSDFVALPPGEIDRGINTALKAIGEFISVDRSYVFILSDDGAALRNTHEWRAEGIVPQIDDLQALSTGAAAWLMDKLERNEVAHIPRLDDLPAEASALRDLFKALEIRSVLAVPMRDGERLVGLLGLDSVRRERTWTRESISLMCVAANIFAGALRRKQAEEDLHHSEEHLRAVFSSLHETAIGIYDRDGTISDTWGDPDLDRRFGITSEQVRGKNLRELLPPEQAEERIVRVREVYETGNSLFDEYLVQLPGGAFWLETALSPMRDADGNVSAVVGVIRDVTERKQAEDDLRRSEGRLQAIFSALHNTGILVYDRNGTVLDAWGSADLDERFDLPASELRGLSVHDIWPPGEAERYAGSIARVFDTGQNEFGEYTLVRPSGQFQLSVTFSPMRGADGTVANVVGFCRNVTRQRRTEQELRTERDNSARIISNTPAIICRIAPDGTTLSVNPAGERITGYRAEEIIGRNWWNTLYPGREHSQVEKLYRDFRHGDVRDYEMTLTTRSGEKRIVSWNSINRLDEDGRIVEIIGFGNDVTGRRRAERDLRKAHERIVNAREEERRRLASELHDSISQDIVAMQLSIQEVAAAARGRLDVEQNRVLNAAAHNCAQLVREVRDICHGLYPPVLHTLGLVSALRQLGRYCGRKVEFALRCPADIDKQRFDEECEIALYRIAQEAVNNALRHSGAGTIELRLARDDHELALEIIDDGAGFDPLRRAAGGLGLATMNDRAEAAGGRLTVASEPGRTCVKVALPLERPAE